VVAGVIQSRMKAIPLHRFLSFVLGLKRSNHLLSSLRRV
jgi:hypothetical protein